LPKFSSKKTLYIGFFNTGAYQDGIGGIGGLQHCLIPSPKHIIVDKDENGNIISELFMEEQNHNDMLKILGYQ
jgi:arginine decarboxylase